MTSGLEISAATARASTAARQTPDYVALATLTAAILGAIGFHWYGLISLGQAWSTAEYSHGPLIPVLSFILFLKHLKVVPPHHAAERERRTGIAVAVFALFIGTIGNIARIPDIVTYGLIVWIFGLTLTAFGFKRGFVFWTAVVHLVFMLPLPSFLYWKVSITLQYISAEIGVAIIRSLSIPVFLDGNIIDLGLYRLDVAEACSGLRYLFPIMSFSYIFCMLYNGPIWHKAVLLISAAPLTMLMNSVRIGIIGVLVNAYGIEQAEGFLHFFEGWVIFLSCIAILFGLTRVLQFLNRDKRPMLEVLELDFTGMSHQARRVMTIRRSNGMLILAAVTGVAALLTHFTPLPDPAPIKRDPLVLFPHQLGDWRAGPAQRLDPNVEAVLKADDYYGADFKNADAPAGVSLFIAWYRTQTEGSGIHSPEVCLPTGGWEMSEIAAAKVTATLPDGGTALVDVNRATIRKGLSRQLVYYWFEQRGRRMTSDYAAKAVTVLDAVTIGRTDGALVRLVTQILPSETEAEAGERMNAFLGRLLPVLPTFVPQ